MAWLEVKGILINLENVKHFETSKDSRYVAVHFLRDPTPLLLPFDSAEQAKEWLEAVSVFLKAELKEKVLKANFDFSKLN